MNFYEQCAKIMGVDYSCNSFLGRRRNRWNNRHPGNGRFEGFGIIRKFGSKIQVALRCPLTLHIICDSEEEVLNLLRNLYGPKF